MSDRLASRNGRAQWPLNRLPATARQLGTSSGSTECMRGAKSCPRAGETEVTHTWGRMWGVDELHED